jgi:LuxR family transcriptional regulator, maltose regulon positive regulatory protein
MSTQRAVPLLLTTKLRPPRLRADRISRPQLVARLRAGIDRPLTLLSAPAGSGKTTLLGDWLQAVDRPVAWISLDVGDNDPIRFLAYLGAALATCDPLLGQAVQAQIQDPPAWEGLIVTLVNAIADAPPFILVLDDYHTITAAPVQTLVASLVEQAPALLHLVISTRADPPFALARLRARGALTELRAPDLRFTLAEAAALTTAVSQIALTPAQIARLAERTEGWAAGLQLAALALYGRADIDRFISQFGGGHQYVLDYLVEEVLAHQSGEVQEFLLCSAILDRMCAELCDALLQEAGGGRQDAGNPCLLPPASCLLPEIERANLFLIPLDDERHWYRYHHLLADLLRLRLTQAHPGPASTLHRRAAAWFEAHGLPDEAISHALAGGDVDHAARLMVRLAPIRMQRGEALTVQGWLAALPESLVAAHPTLLATRCWLLWLYGQLSALDPHLRALERALADPDRTHERELRAQAALLRAYLARRQSAYPAALAAARQALAMTPESNTMLYGMAATILGHLARDTGDLVQAIASFQAGLDALWSANITTLIPSMALYLVRALLQQGQQPIADAVSRTTLRRITLAGWDAAPQVGAARIALAEVLRAQHDLDGAATAAGDGLEQVRRGGFADLIRSGAITLARVRLAQGDRSGAQATLDEAARAAEATDLPWGLAEVAAAQVQLALAQGNPVAARHAAARLAALAAGANSCAYLQELATLAAAESDLHPASCIPHPLTEPLSERELEVLRLLVAGRSNRAIAAALTIAEGTVKSHIHHIYGKLTVGGRVEAVARARDLGLL